MTGFPHDPHAIIKIDRSGGGEAVVYDSWEDEGLFKGIDIELVTNQTSEARIKLFDPKFRVIDKFSDATAKAVFTVYLGYGQDLGQPIFKGILGQIERGNSETTFVVFDMAFVMKLIKKAGYKNKRDDLAIIRDLVTRNKKPDGKPLEFEGPKAVKPLEPHKAISQDQMTDWEWMTERAKDSGLVVFVRQDTVFAKYPATVEKPSLTLVNGKDFTLLNGWDFTYKTPENQDGKPKVVKHRRRGKGGKRIEGQWPKDYIGDEKMVLKRDLPGKATKSKLSKRAEAQRDLEREHAFEGHIETLFPANGSRLDVRNTIKVKEIGKLFSGDYICDTACYSFSAGKLSLNLDLYRDVK